MKYKTKNEFVLACYKGYDKKLKGRQLYPHPSFIRGNSYIMSFPGKSGLKGLIRLAKMNVPLAIIYRNDNNKEVKRFKYGVEVPTGNIKTLPYSQTYGKEISLLGMTVYFKSERIHEINPKFVLKKEDVFFSKIYSDIRNDEKGVEYSYWFLINNFLKGIFRGKYITAVIYNRNKELIGKYIGANGYGNFHKQKILPK